MVRTAGRGVTLTLQAVAGLEDPGNENEACEEERGDRGQADTDADVRGAEERPAETADQINDRVEQRDGAPRLGQHRYRIKRAAEERERRDHQHRNELQLVEAL